MTRDVTTPTSVADGVRVPAAPLARKAVAVLGFATLTAVAARIAVPLPGTQVPFTLQVLAVLLSGLALGRSLGAASQLVYLAAGVAGLPVFAAGGGLGYLLGPTGGYLLAYPLAAALAGFGGDRLRGLWSVAGMLVVATAVIHAGGLAWLAILTDARVALETGVLPFLGGDALKIGLALLVGTRLRVPVGRFLG